MTLVNPYTRWPISQGWRQGSHAIPGRGPAIDYAIPYGTVLLSPDAGRVSLSQDPAAGLRVALIRDDGSQIILCHNSEWLVKNGQRVSALQPLAESGNTGTVDPAPTPENPHAGSHLHTYGLDADGNRWNWTLDAADLASIGDTTPLEPTTPKEDEMLLITAPGVHPALLELGAFTIVNDGEKLTVARQLASRRIDFATKREFQVARGLSVYAMTPSTTVQLTEAQLEAITAAAREGGLEAIQDLEFVVTVAQ